jgi:hypothetical protein
MRGKEDHDAEAVESGGGACRGPAAGEEAAQLNGGGGSCGAVAWHASKAEVETAASSSSPPALPLSSLPLAASCGLLRDVLNTFFLP